MGNQVKISGGKLKKLIEEATMDAYGDEEQETGFLTMLQDYLPIPFKALIVGEEVEVVEVDKGREGHCIMVICKRDGKKYKVSVTSLEWPGRPPKAAEWIEAYKAWVRGGW